MDKWLLFFREFQTTRDGIDLLEYLKERSVANYEAFKVSPPEYDLYHKGYACAIDQLIKDISNANDRLVKQEVVDNKEWL